jgi:hypothetical protein
MTTQELATAIGQAVEGSFRQHIATPEDIGTAVRSNLEPFATETSARLENLGRGLSAVSDEMNTGLKQTVGEMTSGLQQNVEALKSSLAQHADQVSSSGGNWGDQMQGILNAHSSAIAAASTELIDDLKKFMTENNAQVQGFISENNTKIVESSSALGEQLGKIAQLQANIEQVLHVQEMVDNTMKSVATTEEFKETISSLRKHVEESDNLLREVTKPRKIRLVEQEQD